MQKKYKYLLLSIGCFLSASILHIVNVFIGLTKGESSLAKFIVVLLIVLYIIFFVLFLLNIKNKVEESKESENT
ncbi:hypothetical protein [Flavobacterium lacus]|uniref:Uncharacterized protein n=1 Tax=Flavobacterium lacus TaxID=1353778 RepID=A0A328WXM9_9FLAO|nr:hypothetical protein [Flavobacterium lacus]RAR51041.1 hypothetical protein B0I10_101214 [Flavobacterium lacus]